MVFLSIRKITSWLKLYVRRKLEFTTFVRRFRGNNGPGKMCTSCWRKLTPLAHDKASERQWPSAISSQIGISENIELVEIICSHESALHIHKSPYKIERRRALHGRPFSALQSTILQLEMCSACRGLLSFATWHLVFSKIVSNKLQINVKNKITVICAKFGTDMINICDVTSRKTKWPHFYAPACICIFYAV